MIVATKKTNKKKAFISQFSKLSNDNAWCHVTESFKKKKMSSFRQKREQKRGRKNT